MKNSKQISLLLFSVFLVPDIALSALDGPIESKLEQPFIQNQKLFANVEVKHFTQTFYDKEGYLLRQDPSLETIGKVGLRYYRGAFEVFAQAGIIKVPDSQKIIQINVDPDEIGKNMRYDIGIEADAREGLSQLLEQLRAVSSPKESRCQEIESYKNAFARNSMVEIPAAPNSIHITMIW